MTTTLQPLQQNKRDGSLDLLRGFAMAGVLFMFCVNDIRSPENYEYGFWDEFIDWPKWILVEERTYSLLILVFGYGFGIQLQKADEKGRPFMPVYLRRLAGLLIIGALHALLLSKRDILFDYGVAGIALLAVRKFSNRQLTIVILLLLVFMVTPLSNMIFPQIWVEIKKLIQPNNYYDTLKYNRDYFFLSHQAYSIYIDMFFHFLLGFLFSRMKLLQRLRTDRELRVSVLLSAFVIAVLSGLFNFWWVEPSGWDIISQMKKGGIKFFAASGLYLTGYVFRMSSLCLYVCLLLFVYNSMRKKQSALASFGQMAMSNYLIQSLVLVPFLLLFNLYNNMPPAKGIFLFATVFSIQLWFSKWWMRKFYFGPFEWLLRSFTYRKWQPMKKQATVPDDLHVTLLPE